MSEKWMSVSVVGDHWEVEMNVFGDPKDRTTYRYRSAMFGRLRTGWEIGRPPTGVHAVKQREKDGPQ